MSGSTWIISFIVAVVAICAGMAFMGFKGRITTVGVDLGTTFSVVGINVNGKVVIVEDKLGRKIFPSIISYGDNGNILAAYDAIPQLSLNPTNTIYNAKRFIGRSLEEENVKAYAAEHAFNVVASNLSNFSKVGFEISSSGHNSVITPEQVGTQVLNFLMGITAEFLGHNQVNKAVIAVPAKFDANQRKATGDAYAKAGLKVVRVIEEPTAAAVAYKLHKKSNIHHILVYDFGGGTLDVSLLYVAKGSVQVYATDGDEILGGSDFDICLSTMLQGKVEAAAGKTLVDLPIQGDFAEDICMPSSIRIQAEKIKKALTYEDAVDFKCFMESMSGQEIKFSVSKLEDFEQGCGHLFERAMVPVERLLDDLEMTHLDIDEVVLVGGSTRIPHVKKVLKDYFKKDLNDHIDPDVTVAYGAASILD